MSEEDSIFIMTDGDVGTKTASLVDGKVPSAELPSYVDDVKEYNGIANFPGKSGGANESVAPEGDKIYVDTATNRTYRWGGSDYIEISSPDLTGYALKEDATLTERSGYTEWVLTGVGRTLSSYTQPEWSSEASQWDCSCDINGRSYDLTSNSGSGSAATRDSVSMNLYEMSEGDLYATAVRSAKTGYQLGNSLNNDKPVAKDDDLQALAAATQTSLDGKVDRSGDTMTGTLTVPALTVGSRAEGSTVGANSVAEGDSTTASSYASHAEGDSTTASAPNSHAEGNHTTAGGPDSHAEGASTAAIGPASHAEGDSTTASSYASHAEGDSTTASAPNSHAEGNHTTAGGPDSHAEGASTAAIGPASHAEGDNTATQNSAEHAQGQYNASHTVVNSSFGNPGNTLSSIGFGSGSGTTPRKNAMEVMQDGRTFIYGLGGYNGTNPTGSGVKDIVSLVDGKAEIEDIAPEFYAGGTYQKNELVVHEGALYRCTSQNGHSGAWLAADFEVTTVLSFIEHLVSDGIVVNGTTYVLSEKRAVTASTTLGQFAGLS